MRWALATLVGLFGCILTAFSLIAARFPASRMDSMPWLGSLQRYGPFAGLILFLVGALLFAAASRHQRRQQDAAMSAGQNALAYAQARALWRQGQYQEAADLLRAIAPYYPPAAAALRRIQVMHKDRS